jgi:hypothetical protein
VLDAHTRIERAVGILEHGLNRAAVMGEVVAGEGRDLFALEAQ